MDKTSTYLSILNKLLQSDYIWAIGPSGGYTFLTKC